MTDRIERQIIIGLIVSTDYLQRIRPKWDERYLKAAVAKRLASWCIEYFDKYQRAPYSDIEGIYSEKLKTLPKDIAEEIEEDILPGLDAEYEEGRQFNSDYLLDRTKEYFRKRHLELHQEEVKALMDEGNIEEAEALAAAFKENPDELKIGIDLGSEEALVEIDSAFNQTLQRVITYPGALGQLWNEQLIRGSFVGLLAPEKRGKTYWLLELAMRAIMKKANVAFFQAGDMTQAQQLKRLCVYLAKKSYLTKYCGKIFIPVKDCLLQQLDSCDHPDRESSWGPLEILKHSADDKPDEIRKQITFSTLFKAYEENPDYRPCHNCRNWMNHGSVWLAPYETGPPLQAEEAKQILTKFFHKYKRRFMLSTHVNGTLSVREIQTILHHWEQEEGFVPDVIIIDYADLLIPDGRTEFRHGQDQIWRGLRGLSQEKHCLVVTATQADASSYEQDTLKLKNFTEDKRKFAHVTAMYGLNQDPKGREKQIGLMRINELVVREGESFTGRAVYVLQKLQLGRPYLGSYL